MHQIVNREAMESGAFVLVPRLDVQHSAGHGSFAIDEHVRDFIAFDPSYLRAAGIDPRAAHVVQVDGRSMMPNLVHGEWVIVDASATAILNGAIYALVLNGVALVKRLRRIKGGGVMVISDNKDEGYEDELVEGEELNDLRIVGRVRKHLRSL